MITILEKFLTGLERGGWGEGKSNYKDCLRSQKCNLALANVVVLSSGPLFKANTGNF